MVGGHDFLQHAPVGARGVLGDAAAALKVELVHLLADVVVQHIAVGPDCLLERANWWACMETARGIETLPPDSTLHNTSVRTCMLTPEAGVLLQWK